MKKLNIEQTKLKNEWGRLEDFFHSTPVPGGIEQYLPLSHFGTERAAKQRAVHFVLDALGIREEGTLPEHIPVKYIERLGNKVPPISTQKVHLYMQHPLKMPDLGRHDLSQYWGWFTASYEPKSKFLSGSEWRELDAVGHRHMRYKQAISEFIFVDPFAQKEEDLIRELDAERLFKSKDWIDKQVGTYPTFLKYVIDNAKRLPYGLAEHVAFQRMIRFLEGEGYDGFKYENTFEDEGKLSYIIFRPQQVFNVLVPEQIHYIETPDPESADCLFKNEKKFFTSYGVLSPTERILQSKKNTQSHKVLNALRPEQIHYIETPDPASTDRLFKKEKKLFTSHGVLSPTECILQSKKKQQSHT